MELPTWVLTQSWSYAPHPAAARCLFFTLNDFMTDLGFVKARFDKSVWVQTHFQRRLVVGVHIDDSLIASSDLGELEEFE